MEKPQEKEADKLAFERWLSLNRFREWQVHVRSRESIEHTDPGGALDKRDRERQRLWKTCLSLTRSLEQLDRDFASGLDSKIRHEDLIAREFLMDYRKKEIKTKIQVHDWEAKRMDDLRSLQG